MFKNLVASEGSKKKSATFGTLATSVVLHGLLVAGAVAASVVVPEVTKSEELVDFVELEPEPEPVEAEPEPEPEPEVPEPAPPEPQPVAAPPPVAQGYQELVPPKEPPPAIPDVDVKQQAVRVEDFSGVGQRGGASDGVRTGVAQSTAEREAPADQGVYELSVVSEQPKLQNGPEIARQLQRQYPPLLRDSGVTGSATVSFVVGADGRVEGASVTVVSSTHEQFGEAAKRVVERMRFSPARVNRQGVRVAVTQPIAFNLER
ncbi:MAG: TonB family protein [Gemmatimonadota bacterium]|nr:TonB family protein [Gemmatimonadota bacterium]